MRLKHSLGLLAASALLACEAPAADPQPAAEAAVLAHASASHSSHGGGYRHRNIGQEDLSAVRRATAAFHSIPQVETAGYAAFGGCFQDPTLGAMGFHWANQGLIADSTIDPLRPELMVYQPLASGELELAAVEYIVFQDEWHAKGHVDPPSLFGEEFHLNPTLLEKPFYLLHAWVWFPNPSGILTDWNPRVRCP